MEFMFNELSFHGQFVTAAQAQGALKELLSFRQHIVRHGHVLRSGALLERPITAQAAVRAILNNWPDRSLKELVRTWLTKDGPFWDREPQHGPDDYFECRGDVVTGCGIAEAAMDALQGGQRELISAAPSDWETTPIAVDWHEQDRTMQTVELWNTWRVADLPARLSMCEAEPSSWADLVAWAQRTCEHLTLAGDVIEPLARHPFRLGAAQQLKVLLLVLDKLKASIGADGKLNATGMHLHENHFVGKKAWFTDSSDQEKIDFQNGLTFKQPGNPSAKLFCPWHGKVKIDQLRVHFSYPVQYEHPLYVVYIGPKITKY